MQFILPLLGWVVMALLVGYVGKAKTLGFWGYFLIAVLLSPLIGLVGIFVEDQIVARRAAQLTAPHPVEPAPQPR